MGIFDDFGINPDEIKESSFDIDDGTYLFEIGEAERQDGTTNNPENTVFYIDYSLFNEDEESVGDKRAYYTLAEDGDSETKRVKQSMSFFKADLKRLGVTDLSSFDGSELIGLRGVLQLVTVPGKGVNRNKTFQNIRNIRLDEADEQEAPVVKKPVASAKKAPARPAAKDTTEDDAAAKERIAARRAARAAEPDDESGNPFGG